MRPLLCLLLLALCIAAPGLADEEPNERDAVLGLIAPRRGEVIADLGCGRGDWSFELARSVGPQGRVFAVDIDPDAIAAVQARLETETLDNITAIQSKPDDPSLEAGRFDAVFLNDVIDWVERQYLAGFLAGIREALKADGRLVIRDPSGGAGRVIAECYRAGFALVEAKIPLANTPARSFSTGWYALKLRPSDVQPAILPRLGRPARYRVRLHLAEELFRMGLLTRDELRTRWEAIRDRPGGFDPDTDEALDLVRAAEAVDVLTPEEAEALREKLNTPR
ncbi:MAG: class I SAM-dependent methyltransferase [Planctomycetota bacterium]|jgi:ubiquinone/menaquinone biosynthesis C-methylase UbiE